MGDINRFLTLTLLLASTTAFSADWGSCADDLDRLRRASRTAADVAEQVKSKASDLENCRRFPGSYDLLRDRCQSRATDYEGEVSRLKLELATMNFIVRSASSSCEVDLGSARGGVSKPSTGNRQCDAYRTYKGLIPDATLMQICTKSLSEQECKKCLSEQ